MTGVDVARSWDPKLKIDVAAIDSQHEGLFDRFDTFVEAASARDHGAVRREASDALAFLARFVDEHFGDEELAMAESGYPDLERHRELHRAFTRELAGLVERHRVQGATPSFLLALANLFESWLTLHISQVDQRLGEFLRGR